MRIMIAVVLLLTACGTSSPQPAATKSGTGELRTDLEPLTKRFPALGTPAEARWMSGTYGSDRNPGPSTYWIDAIVTLSAASADELKTYNLSTGPAPDVVEALRPSLPAGPLLTSDELNKTFTVSPWSAKAYYDPERRTLVLVATGT